MAKLTPAQERVMDKQQKIALDHHCRFAFETVHPRFAVRYDNYSVILTVNSGHE